MLEELPVIITPREESGVPVRPDEELGIALTEKISRCMAVSQLRSGKPLGEDGMTTEVLRPGGGVSCTVVETPC